MKKILILGIVCTLMIAFSGFQTAYSVDIKTGTKANTKADNTLIKAAIKKYKDKNYIGCISDLRQYVEYDRSNAVAWYYLGSSYMNIAMRDEAFEAYENVISLNTVPKLTSYAIQAELCMQNTENCEYKNFTKDEIKQLKSNPTQFLAEYAAKQVEPKKTPEVQDIEKLIHGGYGSTVHPNAGRFIEQERMKIKQNTINQSN